MSMIKICHSATDRVILGTGAVLDGEQVLPGFQFQISDLFKEEDWDET